MKKILLIALSLFFISCGDTQDTNTQDEELKNNNTKNKTDIVFNVPKISGVVSATNDVKDLDKN